MTSPDPGDEPTLDDALEEAAASLRTGYPGVAFPDDEPTLDALTALLATSADDGRRRDAAQILEMLAEGFPADLARIVPALVAHLDDDALRDPLLRALGYVSTERPDAVAPHVDALAGLLESDDASVVRDATWTLANVAAADPDTVAGLFPRFADLLSSDGPVRRHAARALAAAPESVLVDDPTVLDRLVDDLDSSSRYRTVGRTLVAVAPAYGDRVVDELFACLDDGRPAVREHAAWTLVPLADDHPGLVRPRWRDLLAVLRTDDDHQVRNSAAAALAALATDSPDDDLLQSLVAVLDHDDMFVRRYGCLALGDVAVETGDERVLSALVDARDDPGDVVRQEAETQLADAAAEHPDAVSSLTDDVPDRSDDVAGP